MSRYASIRQRPFLWMLIVALVVLAVIAVTRILALRGELQDQLAKQLQGQVTDVVDAWETDLVQKLDDWLEDAVLDPSNAEDWQRQVRKRDPVFDSLYVWVPPRAVPVGGAPKVMRGSLLFPKYPASEDTRRILLHPCLGRARAMSIVADVDSVEMAARYIEGCEHEPLQVRLIAATEAATLLHRQGLDQEALRALDSARVPPSLPIAKGIAGGIPPFRLVGHRTQRAEILFAMGRTDEALGLLEDTGLQVAQLDAPQADGLLPYVRWPIIAELRAHRRAESAARLEGLLEQAERRARGWREVEDRILSTPLEPGEARFVYDQYRATPFVLYYGAAHGDQYGAAIVLDQPRLVREFLSQLPRLADFVSITDAEGTLVAGTARPGATAFRVPFSRTLTHLRVDVKTAAITGEMKRYGNQWITPLVVTLIFVLVGMAGLVAQIRAQNRQYELMMRQREFTTRVTHELKTPLAGIRVMAENLELGAYKSERHLQEMAHRIVDEADRLTSRVDEILSVQRERTVPNARPFDPEEAVLEAIDTWGPRLDSAGVKLSADLHPTEEVLGDPQAIRDAVGCLLDNALKYHDEARADPSVWLTLKQEGAEIVVEVSDNGLGVPKDMRKSIFERFVRVEGPNRGRSGGHGLGLAQVAEVLRMHRGSASCDESDQGGARFQLRLPAHA